MPQGKGRKPRPRGRATTRFPEPPKTKLKVSSPTTLAIQAVVLIVLYAGVAGIYFQASSILPSGELREIDARITELQQDLEAARKKEQANISPDARAKASGEMTRISSEITEATQERSERLTELKEQEAELVAYGHANGSKLMWICIALSLMAAALGVPYRLILVAAYGYIFQQVYDEAGVMYAVIAAATGEAVGSTLQYWIVHWFLRDVVKRVNPGRVKAIDTVFGSEAAFVLFSLRLVPGIPYMVTNLIIGLSPIRTITFLLVSTLALTPTYIVYAYAGADLTSLDALLVEGPGESVQSPTLWISLAVVGMLPLVIRLLTNKEVRGGFRQLKDLADDSEAPTLDDAKADISELEDEEAPAGKRRPVRSSSGRVRR